MESLKQDQVNSRISKAYIFNPVYCIVSVFNSGVLDIPKCVMVVITHVVQKSHHIIQCCHDFFALSTHLVGRSVSTNRRCMNIRTSA